MADRFFSSTPVSGPTVELTGDQAHHLANVMRAVSGDRVGLFDIDGREFVAVVSEVSKKRVLLQIHEELPREEDTLPRITVAVAMPRGDRQKFLIEKLVELGAIAVIPLSTKRGVAVVKENVVKRMEKQVIEACKQCGRNRLMTIETPLTIADLIHSMSGDTETLRLLAEPRCEPTIREVTSGQPHGFPALVAIGPEGGFSDQEVQQLTEAGFQPCRIGDSILRIETAAIAALTLLRCTQ
ncbi:MAG: 16S rRNA (uracil(1498)-N(3))-methyltransferase [Planctomycetota bacterium]